MVIYCNGRKFNIESMKQALMKSQARHLCYSDQFKTAIAFKSLQTYFYSVDLFKFCQNDVICSLKAIVLALSKDHVYFKLICIVLKEHFQGITVFDT